MILEPEAQTKTFLQRTYAKAPTELRGPPIKTVSQPVNLAPTLQYEVEKMALDLFGNLVDDNPPSLWAS